MSTHEGSEADDTPAEGQRRPTAQTNIGDEALEPEAMLDGYLFQHEATLQGATFIERPHRFCTHCRLDATGEEIMSHLPDPGRLKEVLLPGVKLFVTGPHGPKRKLPYTTVLAKPEGVFVNLVSSLANKLFEPLMRRGHLRGLVQPHDIEQVEREVRVEDHRIDFRVHDPEGEHLIEVKHVGLHAGEGWGLFPDAPSKRAVSHVKTLTRHVHEGGRASLVFIAGRGDIHRFAPANHIDPGFTAALLQAVDAGVGVFALGVSMDTFGAFNPKSLEIQLEQTTSITIRTT